LADCNQSACGQSPEATAYLLDFLLVQVTSTLANQYSVLCMHAFFLLSSLRPLSGPKFFKEEFVRRRRQRRRLEPGSTALVEIPIDFAGRSHAAFGRRPEAAAYPLDFLTRQITSAPAGQHSVLITHGVFSFHDWAHGTGPSLTKMFSAALKRSRARLAADFTNVLISIRRGTAAAQGKSPKASIDKVGFRGRQLASTPADQYSFFVIHVWFSFRHFGSVERARA
jgi:hypothetical protein